MPTIRERLETATDDQALDLVADFLGVARLEQLPRPGDVAAWRLADWETAAGILGFAADGRTKHSFLFRHQRLPVTFGLATTPSDGRSWANTCGDLRRRWRILLLEAAAALRRPVPGVGEEALRRRALEDLARGAVEDREEAQAVRRAGQALERREELLRKLMREGGVSRAEAEALAALVLDERPDEAPGPEAWAEAAEEALRRQREAERTRKAAERAEREAERQARAAERSDRVEERAGREAERQAAEAARAAERAKALERAAFWEAVEERRREARRALNEGDRLVNELVAQRLDQAEARLAGLKARLRELLAAADAEALAEARRLVAE